jgi:uncharacterized protein
MDVKDKVVLVTGSSSGIGKETAIRFAQKGCSVVITYNKGKENGEHVLKECEKYAPCMLIHLDVTDDNSIGGAVKKVLEKWGRLDILVNNAGTVVGNLLMGQSIKDIEEQIKVDLLGCMKVTKAFLPQFYQQQSGLIINIGSGAGKKGRSGLTVYCAAKFGLQGFTQALAKELPPQIRVYCVNPRITATRVTNYEGTDPAEVAEIILLTAEEKFEKESGDDIDVHDFLRKGTMEASYYNLFFPFDDEYICFNTLDESILVVSAELKKRIEGNDISSIHREDMKILQDNGILIDRKRERDEIRLRTYKLGHDTTVTDFHVFTTYQCNVICSYCPQKDTKSMDEKSAARVAEFIKVTAAMNDSNTVRVQLRGGEPLLNMPAALLIADKVQTWCMDTGKEFSLRVVTNGTLFTEDTIKNLEEYHCRFTVTLDGPREIHDSRRTYKNGKGTFDDIIKGINRLKDTVLIRVPVDQSNTDIVPLFEFLKENNIHSTLFIKSVFSKSPACRWYDYCIPDGEGVKIQHRLSDAAEALGFTVEREESFSKRSCLAERVSYIAIDPYLRLFRCSTLLPSKEHAVGIIGPDSNPVFNYVNADFLSRDPLTFRECHTCKLVPLCNGGCPADVFEAEKTTHNNACKKDEFLTAIKEDVTWLVRRED